MWFYVLGAAVVGADRLAKWFVLHHRHDGPLLGDVLRLTLTENAGAAFGMFAGARAVFVTVAAAAAVALAAANHLLPKGDPRRWWLALLWGGNVGNLIDRVQSGRVVDFLDMGVGSWRWPVYNVADVAIVAGAAGLGVLLWRQRRRTGLPGSAPSPPG